MVDKLPATQVTTGSREAAIADQEGTIASRDAASRARAPRKRSLFGWLRSKIVLRVDPL
jgi:hypothetical protein